MNHFFSDTTPAFVESCLLSLRKKIRIKTNFLCFCGWESKKEFLSSWSLKRLHGQNVSSSFYIHGVQQLVSPLCFCFVIFPCLNCGWRQRPKCKCVAHTTVKVAHIFRKLTFSTFFILFLLLLL